MTEGSGLADILAIGNDAGGIGIVGLPAADYPTDPQDAATKGYADSAGGLIVSATDPSQGETVPVGAGRIWVDTDGSGGATVWQRRNATDDGWDAPFLRMETDGTLVVMGDGMEPLLLVNGLATVTLAADGAVTVAQNAIPVLTIAADGGITAVGNDALLELGVGGGNIIALEGAYNLGIDFTNGLTFNGPIVASALPTADPVVAGALWNDTGTVKVSAG